MTEIYIITGGKKENSTKRLSFDGVQPFQCTLKTPTSIERPVITITTFVPGARYAWIPSFNRYYFIEDIVCAHNQSFVYYLSIDVLGTYREDIRLLTLYSIRSSAGSALLPDPMYTHRNNVQSTGAIGQFTTGPGFTVSTGSFALETVGGGSSSGSGGTSMYLVTPAVMSQLMSEIFNPSSTIYGGEFDDDVVKTYFNPFQYIVSCKWFPFSFGSGTDRIKFGFWESSYTGIKYNAPNFGFTKNFEITVPKPNGDSFTSFSPAWVSHLMYVPMFGYFPIDAKYSGKAIVGHIAADFYTGNGNLDIIIDAHTVQTLTGQCGISVNLSQLAVDTSNIGTTIFGTAEHLFPGAISDTFSGKGGIDSYIANILGIATNFVSKIPGLDGSSIKESMSPALTMCGTNGNRMILQDNYGVYINTTYFSPDNAVAVHDMFNYPDDQERLLDNLSGYAIFKTDAVGIGNAAESAAILAYLNGGVFLE